MGAGAAKRWERRNTKPEEETKLMTPGAITSMESTRPELGQNKFACAEIISADASLGSGRFLMLAAVRLKALWRSARSRAASKRKTLSVRETVALGDRRFISVVQFGRQRFLVGSSPAAITLLAQLPDDAANEAAGGIEAGEGR